MKYSPELTEKIFLGLRSQTGIEKSQLSETMRQKAEYLVNENKLSPSKTHYYNTDYFLSDELALYILG